MQTWKCEENICSGLHLERHTCKMKSNLLPEGCKQQQEQWAASNSHLINCDSSLQQRPLTAARLRVISCASGGGRTDARLQRCEWRRLFIYASHSRQWTQMVEAALAASLSRLVQKNCFVFLPFKVSRLTQCCVVLKCTIWTIGSDCHLPGKGTSWCTDLPTNC